MSSGTSYNGWPANSDPSAIDVQPFGDRYGLPFPGGVRGGDVTTVLGYVAVQLHERVEPAVDGWNWGYNYRANVNNPSSLSCHASATAIDWSAPAHPNGAAGTFTSDQVAEIRKILAEVQGAVQWGGDYSGTTDEMHFEIIVSAATLARVAATLPVPQPNPPPEDENMASTVCARESTGVLHVWAVAEDGRVLEKWTDPQAPSGWADWTAGVPGDWAGGLSVVLGPDNLPQLFGVAGDGVTVQSVWSSGTRWEGPVPFPGLTAK